MRPTAAAETGPRFPAKCGGNSPRGENTPKGLDQSARISRTVCLEIP